MRQTLTGNDNVTSARTPRPMISSKFGFVPDWHVPQQVKAFVTHRCCGVSQGSYESFNLGDHVGDDQQHVDRNRETLIDELNLPHAPNWLQQVHGNKVVNGHTIVRNPVADAIFTDRPNTVCAILTADCLPILMCSQDGLEVAAVHAGWKGLLTDVIAATIEKFSVPRETISAYIGPAISARNYEVGIELRDKFIAADTNYESAFLPNAESAPGKRQMALATVAEMQLMKLGLVDIAASNICTFEKQTHYYSYRRDGVSGRFASLIWRSE